MQNNQSGPMGLRDLKACAKQLKAELAHLDTATVDLLCCRKVVDRLLPPSRKYTETSVLPPPDNRGTSEELLVLSGDPPPLESFIPLGQQITHEGTAPNVMHRLKSWIAPPQQLNWTHQGALHHAVLFGSCGAGVSETLLSMVAAAMNKDCGVFHFDAIGFDRSLKNALSYAQECNQVERVRLINLTGTQGHTYNPFAKGAASDLKQVLLTALLASMKSFETLSTRNFNQQLDFLLSVIMDYLVWGRDTRRWGLDLAKVGEGLSFHGMWSAWQDPAIPADIKERLRSFIRTLSPNENQAQAKAAYEPWQVAIVDQIIHPASEAFASTMKSSKDNKGWRLPDLDMVDAQRKGLWVFWSLPAVEKSFPWTMLPVRLALAELSHHIVSQPDSASGSVRTLLVASYCGGYASHALLAPLMSWGASKGVSCVWSDFDYPALSKGAGMKEVLAQCNTKIFMKMEVATEEITGADYGLGGLIDRRARGSLLNLRDQCEGQAHVIAKSSMYRVNMGYHRFGVPQGTFPMVEVGYQGMFARSNSPERQACVLHDRLHKLGASPDKLSWCQETIARMVGYTHWHERASVEDGSW